MYSILIALFVALASACVPQAASSSDLFGEEKATSLSVACQGGGQCEFGPYEHTCTGMVVCDYGNGNVHRVGKPLSFTASDFVACEDKLYEVSAKMQLQHQSCPSMLRVEEMYFDSVPMVEIKQAREQKSFERNARIGLQQAKVATLQKIAHANELESVEQLMHSATANPSISDFNSEFEYFRFAVWQSQIQAQLQAVDCLLYTSPSPRDATLSRMPSSA